MKPGAGGVFFSHPAGVPFSGKNIWSVSTTTTTPPRFFRLSVRVPLPLLQGEEEEEEEEGSGWSPSSPGRPVDGTRRGGTPQEMIGSGGLPGEWLGAALRQRIPSRLTGDGDAKAKALCSQGVRLRGGAVHSLPAPRRSAAQASIFRNCPSLVT